MPREKTTSGVEQPRKASQGFSQWVLDQKGLWVACPRDLNRSPKSVSEPKARIRSGDTHLVPRDSCMWTKKSDDRFREWCQYCPNSRFRLILDTIMGSADFSWLDDLMKQISLLYQDQFQLTPGGLWSAHREIADVQKHGRVLQVSYRMMFPTEEDDPRNRRLPIGDGQALMDLIEAAAHGAKPGLVKTITRGKHDFCDWYIMPDGHGEIKIYLECPPK